MSDVVQRGRPAPLHSLTLEQRDALERGIKRSGIAPTYRAIGISQWTLESARKGNGLSHESYQRILRFLGAS